MSNSVAKKILIGILIVSSILRIGWLSRGDTVSDEIFYGFRAVGLMDFDEASKQTTPLEWWDPTPPWWVGLSFHDHPPLVFVVQHISFKIFGENNFALRFPSALLGITSVYLVFLIGALLLSPVAGLVSAGVLSVTLNHIYISRLGMQESFVIFFTLLVLYLFLRAVRGRRSLVPAGIALGFALLTKYNMLILIPILGTYLLLFNRALFRGRDLWIACASALFIFSPVVVYNLMLYRAVGHFDFQFSYIFGQHPAVWPVAPGKEIGTFLERIADFIPRLVNSHSWIFLTATLISLFFLRNVFVGVSLAYFFILILVIGPSFRFLTMLTPFFALSLGLFCEKFLARKYGKTLMVFGTLFVAFEIFYSVNNQIIYYPVGASPWLASKVRYENYNWGYNELGKFFKEEFKGKVPEITFRMKYQFLEKIQDSFIANDRDKGSVSYPAMVITEGDFDHGAKLWSLDRLHIYHGWPVIDMSTYQSYLNENGPDYYQRSGFSIYYFVSTANSIPSYEFSALIRDLKPVIIRNPKNEEAFKVYVKK